jgi:hypothetical protein
MKYLYILLISVSFAANFADPSLIQINANSYALGNIGAFINNSSVMFDNSSFLNKIDNNSSLSSLQLFNGYSYYNLAIKYDNMAFGFLRNSIEDNTTTIDSDGDVIPNGSYSYNNNIVFLSYFKKINRVLYGINFKYFFSNLYNVSASGLNLDFSSTYMVASNIYMSTNLKNVLNYGHKGIAWSGNYKENLPFSLALSIKHIGNDYDVYGKMVFDSNSNVATKHLGFSYKLFITELLAGYSEYLEDGILKNTINFGVNISVGMVGISYAYKPIAFDYLNSVNHYASFSINF